MKEELLQFDPNRSPSLSFLNTLPLNERKILSDFEDYCLISAGNVRAQKSKVNALRFIIMSGKSIDKINLEDLRSFLRILNKSDASDYFKNDVKTYVKRFLKWRFKNWSESFDNFNDVRINSDAQRKKPITSKDTLTKKEIEKIMKAEKQLNKKTFFITQYEGALRTKEVRFLQWSMLEFEKDFVFADITSIKNQNASPKKRIVPLKVSTAYLKELRKQQKIEGIDTIWIFPSKRNPNTPISSGCVSKWFKRLTSRAIGRNVTNYLLRHTRGTELKILVKEGKLSKDNALDFMGHSEKMFDKVYSHMDREDQKNILKNQIYDFEYIPEEKKHELEEQLEKHQTKILKLENKMESIKNFGAVSDKLLEDKRVQEALLQAMVKNGLGKQLLELAAK